MPPPDYAYTRPRAPIAAMFSSPGPCYMVPGLIGKTDHDPRSVHYKAPAYCFGDRTKLFSESCSPGPARYSPQMKVYRDGKDGTPQYSLYSRQKGTDQFSTPGPAAYTRADADGQAYSRAPTHVLGAKGAPNTFDCSPAPNAYNQTDAIIGGKSVLSGKDTAPKYTMRPKYVHGAFYEDLRSSPGPAKYNVTSPDVNHQKAPEFSLHDRTKLIGDSINKPSPVSYKPEMHLNAVKKSAPAATFGIRHSPYSSQLMPTGPEE